MELHLILQMVLCLVLGSISNDLEYKFTYRKFIRITFIILSNGNPNTTLSDKKTNLRINHRKKRKLLSFIYRDVIGLEISPSFSKTREM